MKNILIIFLLSFSFSIICMNNGITFKQASADDMPGLLHLINNEAVADKDKIVILPKKFRQMALESSIKKGRLFIAIDTTQKEKEHAVVGFKKLFCMADEKELHEVLNDELRCKGTTPVCAGIAVLDQSKVASFKENAQAIAPALTSATFIYNGSDFTHPKYRGHQINTKLTDFALKFSQQTAIDLISKQKSKHLVLAYGLTKSNAGKSILEGRTKGILQSFIPFAQTITHKLQCKKSSALLCSRHDAFMPTFDPESAECIPLPDDKAVPGFGCILACSLEAEKENV